jgi:hypothetical protein
MKEWKFLGMLLQRRDTANIGQKPKEILGKRTHPDSLLEGVSLDLGGASAYRLQCRS